MPDLIIDDLYPSKRVLAWSPDCSIFAIATTYAHIACYDLLATNLFVIKSVSVDKKIFYKFNYIEVYNIHVNINNTNMYIFFFLKIHKISKQPTDNNYAKEMVFLDLRTRSSKWYD